MVVLSAAVTNRSGKALISRQFVDMTRIRIEGLLAAFPKLLGSEHSKQHTYVETESVRYLYQPLDTLFLLLVTNRASNIVEDLETLRLLSKVVPDVIEASNNISEDRISDNSFELIFAFDEVITNGGYRESVNLQQIRSNLEMESHEERLHNMIKQSKVESAKDQARAAASTIREKMRDIGGMRGIGGGASMGMGGGMPTSPDGYGTEPSFKQQSVFQSSAPPTAPAASNKPAPVKGMSLMAAGGKNKSLEDALYKEDKLAPVMAAQTSAVPSAAAPVQVIQHPVMLVMSERISCKMTRDGTVSSLDIKGSLTLTASDDEAAMCSVRLSGKGNSIFTFTTHPKVNKALYESDNVLQLKDTSKGFPSARPVGILKWTHSSAADDLVPIKINCWPEEESRGQMNVSIEYSMEQPMSLHNVQVAIPLGTTNHPNIISMDGSYKLRDGVLIWDIDMVDSNNSTGHLEFTIQQRDADAFFPIEVNFTSPQLFCGIESVGSVHFVESGNAFQFGFNKSLEAEGYAVL